MLGAALMVVGIALFGMLTATIAAVFVSRDDDAGVTNEQLLEELRALRERVEGLDG